MKPNQLNRHESLRFVRELPDKRRPGTSYVEPQIEVCCQGCGKVYAMGRGRFNRVRTGCAECHHKTWGSFHYSRKHGGCK